MGDDQTRLEDILRAISHIERYATRGRSGFEREESGPTRPVIHLR